MSNSSLPSPSPCGSWPWVIIHTFPRSLSPCLSLSLSLSFPRSEEDSSFLPSFSSSHPTGNLNRIASLQWLIHQHRELHSTPPALQPWQPTTPHPGLDPSPPWPAVCLYHFMSSCLSLPVSVLLSASLPFSVSVCAAAVLSSCLCLPVFMLPSACRYFHQPVLYIFILRICFGLASLLATVAVFQSVP